MTLTSVESTTESAPPPPGKALVTLIKVAGLVISVPAALFSGFLEIFLSPLRVGGFLICVSVVAAVAGNWAIAWFTYTTVGRIRATALPGVVWTGLMLFAAGFRTDEGDYLIAGDNYVALAMIFLGSVTWAFFAYRTMIKRLPPPTPKTGK